MTMAKKAAKTSAVKENVKETAKEVAPVVKETVKEAAATVKAVAAEAKEAVKKAPAKKPAPQPAKPIISYGGFTPKTNTAQNTQASGSKIHKPSNSYTPCPVSGTPGNFTPRPVSSSGSIGAVKPSFGLNSHPARYGHGTLWQRRKEIPAACGDRAGVFDVNLKPDKCINEASVCKNDRPRLFY